MKKMFRYIKVHQARKKRYFRGAAQEIAEKNLKLLGALGLITAGLLLFFFLITPLILPGWTITLQHLLFFPAALLLFLAAFLYRRREQHDPRFITFLCLLFEVVLFTFIILIDILQSGETPSSFMPLLCIALPALFILPFRLIYSILLAFEVIFIAAVHTLKTPFIAQYDIFNSVVGVVFSVIITEIILSLRIQDYENRMKFEHLSTKDTLSGILNKRASLDSAEYYLLHSRPPVSCALLLLDIDDFKAFNDHLGHYTGDILLRSIGELLSGIFRAGDVIGRFGGDEFIVLAKSAADADAMENKCRLFQKKLLALAQENCGAPATCSIGVILVNGQADLESMFRQADAALYEAKAAGKDQFVLHWYKPAE